MILAIDTSSGPASCAVVDDKKVLAEFTVNNKKNHSQTIMPIIEKMLAVAEIDITEIKYIACANGPGSFTGLRIGAATAKGLAAGLGINIIPVPTLDSLAYNIFDTNKLICPIMDARRNQVYTAIYKWESLNLKRITDYMAVDINFIINELLILKEDVVFLGDGVPVNQKIITDLLSFASFAPSHCNMQRAASLGSYAAHIKENHVKYSEFTLLYLRKSQAEREKDLRGV